MKTILLAALLAANSPYIAKVYDFSPAPGQFINDVPETEGNPVEAASAQIVGEATPGLVSLGAFGGYIIFGFDHPVVNVAGVADFVVYGNAILTSEENHIGSAEPGVVWVSRDTDGNGLPDDEWFELAGSESSRSERGLSITYYRPSADHQPVADPERKFLTDAEYIAWECSDGTKGWLQKNNQHSQNYWPDWISEESITFDNVTRLPDNGVDTNGKGTSFSLTYYDWGYADNRPNTVKEGLDISRAIDRNGDPVNLPFIDFVKVQTGVRQNLGWLGESSTEVAGAEDLHPEAPLPPSSVGLIGEDLININPGVIFDLSGHRAPRKGRLIKQTPKGCVIIR